MHYQYGIGVEKDEVKAFDYYKRSAEKEYIEAQFHLSHCYFNGIGTDVDKSIAFKLYKIVAEKEHDVVLGESYPNFKDVIIKKNSKNLKNWYSKAAQ